MSSKETYFFSEHVRNILSEKWSVAIQFPDDKNLINQISARIELVRFVDTFAILDDNNPSDYLIPKQKSLPKVTWKRNRQPLKLVLKILPKLIKHIGMFLLRKGYIYLINKMD